MAKSRAQQAAIAISMKKAGKSPKKKMLKGGRSPYMERMRTYQAGGLSTTAMYGDPRMSDQLVQNIVYQESENQESLEREAEMAAEQDAQARMEAEQELARQYNIGNRIEATGQQALQTGAKTLLKAADPLKGQTPDFVGAMIPNAPDATASLASGTLEGAAKNALVTDAAQDAVTNTTADVATKGAGKLATFASKYVNPQYAKTVSPYAIVGNIAGQGIKYLSDDQDPTTMNFGEGAGGVISGVASGAGLGALLGPAGAVVGGAIGGLYGLGKGLYQRSQARRTIGDLEQEQEDRMANLGARMRAEGVKSRTYSGYDFGRTLAKKGGPRMYQTAGFDMSMLANNPIKNVPAPRQDVLTGYSDAELAVNRAKGEKVAFDNRMNKVADNLYNAGQYIKENPLDAVQVGLGGIAIGADGIPIVGTAVSGAADAINAGISGARSAYYANKGDSTNAAFYGVAAGLDGLAAIPGVGNAAGATKMGMLLNKASHLAHGPIHVAHQGAKAITAGKAATLGTGAVQSTFKKGGVKLPGGTMKPIPGSDAVEFKGKSHKQGGILLDEQTEVEGGETMDKVTMKNGGPSDYFFSKYLKLGGKSYAQRHKDILKKGGSQQDIDALAKSQEMAAGRNPGVVEMEKGGVKMYQEGGLPLLPYPDNVGNLPVMYDRQGNPIPTDLPAPPPYAPFAPVDNTYVYVNTKLPPMGPELEEPLGVNTPVVRTPVRTEEEEKKEGKKEGKKQDKEEEVNEAVELTPKPIPSLVGDAPTLNLVPMFDEQGRELPKTKTEEGKVDEDIKLTKREERALRRMYNDVPMSAKIAGAAQLIPAMYAFGRKEAAQKLMGPAGRIGSPDLQRADYNNERMQNASANRAMGRFIETSGGGPANIISKMAAYSKKQAGDMQIASAEQRANAAIQAQEAEMAQRADMANVQNAMAVDQINTQMIENQRVADENRKYMAIDAAASRGAGFAGDVMSYKADERLARSLGTMGIYERERLGRSLLGKVNPRTGKVYTKADIAKIYNINLDDPGITKEAEAAKNKAKG